MANKVTGRILAVTILGLGLLASACASSSGARRTTTSPAPRPAPAPSPTSPPNYDTTEYNTQPGLAQINALAAYEDGADGDGVIVAIIDTGIDLNNPEFENRIHPDSADLVVNGIVPAMEARTPNLQDQDDHGTPVASIIGAERDGVAVHGVAPEVQLLIFRADDDSVDDSVILGEAIVEGVNRSVVSGAGVMNFSIGSNEMGARADFADIFSYLAGNDIITVTAAGNDGNPDPEESALGAIDATGAATIIAGAVNGSNVIAGFSNRAGIAADYYLVAPGVQIRTIRVDTPRGSTDTFSGTSAAVPHIVGVAALVRGLWPTLTAAEVVQILFDTATDLGDPGVDEIYGHGLVNAGAAVQPVGGVMVTSASGSSVSAEGLSASVSSVFGSGFANLGDIIVFDRYERDFRLSLDDVILQSAPQGFDLEGVYSPFDQHEYASRRITNRLTAEMRLTSRDRAFSDPEGNLAAAFAGADARSDVNDETIALALTNEMGGGSALTVTQGFSAFNADRMISPLRQTPFLSRNAFADSYLPDAKSAITTMYQRPLSSALSADIIVAYAYDYYATRAPLGLVDDHENQMGVTMRAGLNYATPNATLRIEQGLRREEGAILDARFDGDASASTLYSAVDADWRFASRWRLKGRFAAGYTFAKTNGLGNIIDNFSGITSTQFSVALIGEKLLHEEDRLWLGVTQPLQIQSGAAQLILPNGFDKRTEVLSFSTIAVPLAFEGDRFDFEAAYRLMAGPLGAIDLNIVHQTFGEASLEDQTTFLMRGGFDF